MYKVELCEHANKHIYVGIFRHKYTNCLLMLEIGNNKVKIY